MSGEWQRDIGAKRQADHLDSWGKESAALGGVLPPRENCKPDSLLLLVFGKEKKKPATL